MHSIPWAYCCICSPWLGNPSRGALRSRCIYLCLIGPSVLHKDGPLTSILLTIRTAIHCGGAYRTWKRAVLCPLSTPWRGRIAHVRLHRSPQRRGATTIQEFGTTRGTGRSAPRAPPLTGSTVALGTVHRPESVAFDVLHDDTSSRGETH